MYDRLDIEQLKRCKENSDAQLIEIIKPLLKWRSEVQLRDRMNRLEADGLVTLDRTRLRGRVFCDITTEGEKVLREHEAQASEED